MVMTFGISILLIAVFRGSLHKALQVKPQGDAKSVVHHANTYFAEIAEDGSVDRKPVTEYTMGKWGEIVPEGVVAQLCG